MEIDLVIVAGTKAGETIRVGQPRFFIGRAEDCHLRAQNDSVSRHHAVVLVEDDFLAARDLGSKPGTFVNGNRITGETKLKHGDRIRMGELELEVRVGVRASEQDGESPAPPEASASSAKSHQEQDLDLDRWLNDADLRGPAGTEPKEMEIADAPPSGEKGPVAPEQEHKATEEKPVDVVGVWKKGQWKPTAVDPSQAAADTLKNFFKRH
jgi:pSer/pThr/pTyr-binding forkhead associated (FHA) protein